MGLSQGNQGRESSRQVIPKSSFGVVVLMVVVVRLA